MPTTTPIAIAFKPHSPQVQALVSFLEHEPDPMIVLDPEYKHTWLPIPPISASSPASTSRTSATNVTVSRHHYDVPPATRPGEHCPMKKALELRGPDPGFCTSTTRRAVPNMSQSNCAPSLMSAGLSSPMSSGLLSCVARRPALAEMAWSGARQHSIWRCRHCSGAPRRCCRCCCSGESGTGKELFARAVHEGSARASGPFVVVDCSGLTETLFESELFGHEKGAFTGATARKPGLVETAQDGTLFLDEIGDVPLAMQVKLLRLIESGTYRRVGSTETQHANFRLVAATHKSLEKMMMEGAFRPDLYYRISAFPIHLPALRERSDDIALLVHSLLQHSISSQRRLTIEPQALRQLQLRAWPGNIRELRNVLERARLFADDGVIRCEHLLSALGPSAPLSALPTNTIPSGASLPETFAAFGGTRSELATKLGISERTLYRRLKKQGLA